MTGGTRSWSWPHAGRVAEEDVGLACQGRRTAPRATTRWPPLRPSSGNFSVTEMITGASASRAGRSAAATASAAAGIPKPGRQASDPGVQPAPVAQGAVADAES